jgi:hypothetical protein
MAKEGSARSSRMRVKCIYKKDNRSKDNELRRRCFIHTSCVTSLRHVTGCSSTPRVLARDPRIDINSTSACYGLN